nr:hypothetical protein [Tanacetum cinerariifolium]
MAATAAQQIDLDNALVALKKQVEIVKCNMGIDPEMTPKEPTYQVVLDTLALTASKRFPIDIEVFREILQICPRLPDQEFNDIPYEEEILSFIKDHGHTNNVKKITDVVIDIMRQSWRAFAAISNKCLSGKVTDFEYQIDNRDFKKQEKMYYPRFTKAIIHHFLSKDKSISLRNKIFMHTYTLGNLRFVSKDKDTQVYGALINLKIRESSAYHTYFAFATGEATPKPKRIYKKTDSPTIKTITKSPKETPSKKKTAPTKKDVSSKKPSRKQSTGVQIRDTPGVSVLKKKAPITTNKSKGIELLSKAALLEDAQMKKALNMKLRVPDVSKADSSKSENKSWGNSGDDEESDDVDDDESNDDDSDNDDDDNDSDDVRTESNDNKNDDDQEEEYEEEYVHTLKNYESTDDEEEYEELYKDVNMRLRDAEHREEGT